MEGSHMADHPNIYPLCEERFEHLDEQQGEVGRTLQEHGQTLSEHSQTLEHHGRQLARLEEELGRQGDLLSQNQSTRPRRRWLVLFLPWHKTIKGLRKIVECNAISGACHPE